MMQLSNFEYLRTKRTPTQEYLKRAAYLEGQIKALKEYHNRLKKQKGTKAYNQKIAKKRRFVARLIFLYEYMSEKAQSKLEKIGA